MKKFIKLLMTIICMMMLTGCIETKRYIAYSVYPVGYLINRIAGDKVNTISIQTDEMVQVSNIVDNYEEILKDSTYFFHIGKLEPYLDLYSNEITETGVEIVDLSVLNSIYKFQRYTLVYVDGKESYVEGPYYNSELFDKIDTNDNDLMLWMDPIGMLSMANDIYQLLSTNYVEGATAFKDNYSKLESDLIGLDASYQNLSTRLKKENKTIKFVSISASFGNWQKAYGFQIYPVCLSKYGALPSDEELEIIKKRIIDDEVKYIAYEPNMTEDMLNLFNQLETELGLTRVNLNNVSSLTVSQSANNKDYLSLMYENLNVLENMATDIITVNNPTDIDQENTEIDNAE
ncbi:MAG: metal ABC transporter substrate-binding protein [Erysipelotrichaceae bacterium]